MSSDDRGGVRALSLLLRKSFSFECRRPAYEVPEEFPEVGDSAGRLNDEGSSRGLIDAALNERMRELMLTFSSLGCGGGGTGEWGNGESEAGGGVFWGVVLLVCDD